MGSSWKLGRAGVALAAVTATVGLAAAPALAAPAAVKGTLSGSEAGYSVNMSDGRWRIAKLFKLNDLSLYCVQINVRVSDTRTYAEVPWESFPKKDSPFVKNGNKIKWVLSHGYPSQSLEDLKTATGIDLDKKEAISATQAAVWHFSDNINLNTGHDPSEGGDGADKDIVALYEYLIGKNNTGVAENAKGNLAITPASQTGTAGKLIGPFKVETNAVIDKVTANLPKGVVLTDAQGKKLDPAKDVKAGTELYFQVPADAAAGEGTLAVDGEFKSQVGQLFVVEGYETEEAQSLIRADSKSEPLKAEAKGTWTAGPKTEPTTSAPTSAPATTSPAPAPQAKNTEELPDTGASILLPVVIGVVLVGAGAGALVWQRKRKSA